jgi:hypothetical protein
LLAGRTPEGIALLYVPLTVREMASGAIAGAPREVRRTRKSFELVVEPFAASRPRGSPLWRSSREVMDMVRPSIHVIAPIERPTGFMVAI